jgi:hypothetical protein
MRVPHRSQLRVSDVSCGGPFRGRRFFQSMPARAGIFHPAGVPHGCQFSVDRSRPIASRRRRHARLGRSGIRKPNRKDVLVISVDEGATVAGVFTENRFCAAPVIVCREHLAKVVRAARASARWS